MAANDAADSFVISHQILEGHRFAIRNISVGEHLLSWGLTFGQATAPMVPGEYPANDRVLAALRARGLDGLPEKSNFVDLILPHSGVTPEEFVPAEQVNPSIVVFVLYLSTVLLSPLL